MANSLKCWLEVGNEFVLVGVSHASQRPAKLIERITSYVVGDGRQNLWTCGDFVPFFAPTPGGGLVLITIQGRVPFRRQHRRPRAQPGVRA